MNLTTPLPTIAKHSALPAPVFSQTKSAEKICGFKAAMRLYLLVAIMALTGSAAYAQFQFINNAGQWNSPDLYRVDGNSSTVQVRSNGFMLSVIDTTSLSQLHQFDQEREIAIAHHQTPPQKTIQVSQHAWMVEFVGMSPTTTIQPVNEYPSYTNYLIGNKAATNVKSYGEVWYKGVYPDIDARLYAGEGQSMEYDMIVKPGGNPSQIKLHYEGLTGMRVINGQLMLLTIFGEAAYPNPVAYQLINGANVSVKCSYKLVNDVISFTVGNYDKSVPLVIDPIALRWAAYISFKSTAKSGTTAVGHDHGIEVDANGYIYVTGKTNATNFPTTTGVIKTTYNSGSNTECFVCKLNQPTTINGAGSFVWSTYLGGTKGNDNSYSIKLDSSDNIYICGETSSSDFPSTVGSGWISSSGNNAFVTKLNNSGTSIIYSELFGSSGDQNANFMYVTPGGEVWVTGSTASDSIGKSGTAFPTTSGAYQTTYGGGTYDAYFMHLSTTGSILYSTLYGGTGLDVFTCVRAFGNSLIFSGTTLSPNAIASSGAFQTSYVGATDSSGMVVEFNISGTPTRTWGTYINPASGKQMTLLSEQVDSSGNVYFGGYTTGAASAAITTGTYQTAYGGGNHDFYLGKLNSTGASLLAGTYIGGSGDEVNFMGLNIDTYGDIYALGYTSSTNLTTTSGVTGGSALQTTNEGGGHDAIFLKISSDYKTMKYLTYWGGTADDYDPIGFDGIKFSNCRAYTALTTESQDAPMTENSFQASKTSSTSVYEPAIAVWSNPPDLTNDSIFGNEYICYGSLPSAGITSYTASYSLSGISRNGSITNQNSPGGISYSWQYSTDQVNWTTLAGDTGTNLSLAQIQALGPLYKTTYFERIVNGDFCQGSVPNVVTIGVLNALPTIDSVKCYGTATGIITTTLQGAVGPVTYKWNTGASTSGLTNIAAGTYWVTVTDSAGCKTIDTAKVGQPSAALSASITSTTNVKCFGAATGSATVTASNGTAGYTYKWSDAASQTTNPATGLTAGSYTVTVTDARGCTTTASTIITGPAAALGVTVTSSANVKCAGGNGGYVKVTAGGGTTGYTYTWSSGTGVVGGGGTTDSLGGLTGSVKYCVTVTDANSCTVSACDSITQPATSVSVTVTGSANISCSGGNNGYVKVTASGGTPGYGYTWSSGTGVVGGGGTTDSLGGLTGSKKYCVTVTDANSCTTTICDSLTQPTGPVLTGVTATDSVKCYGGSTGDATVTPSGGTAGYTYKWSDPASQTTAKATGLTATTYTVTITDAHGCTATQTATVGQPGAALSATTSTDSVKCFGGNSGDATAIPSGGTAGYTYKWSDPASQTTAKAIGLTAATYTVTVTDSRGCTTTQTATVGQPALPLSATTSTDSVKCFGGNTGDATVVPAGGTAGYTYKWSDPSSQTTTKATGLTANIYTVTVTDSRGCATTQTATVGQPALPLSATISTDSIKCFGGSTGDATVVPSGGTAGYTYKWSDPSSQTTTKAIGLTAATYIVTVTDSRGCTTTQIATVGQPALPLSATTSTDSVKCYGGNTGDATVVPSGGTAGYTYKWSDPSSQTTTKAIGLTAATYTVTVTDSRGCTTIQTATVGQPALPLSATTTTDSVKCFGGNTGDATVIPSGGTAGYTYKWSDPSSQTTTKAIGLTAATYTVTVTDSRGCTTIQTATVGQPALPLSATTTTDSVKCFGGNTGDATAIPSGGTAGYTYKWSDPASQTTAKATGLTANTYTVTVTDSRGCSTTQIATVGQPAAALSATTSTDSVKCFGGSTGDATVVPSGGTAGYTYKWSDPSSQTTTKAIGLTAATYIVTVTDSRGCTTTQIATVGQPAAALSATTSTDSVKCFGGNTGDATAIPSGGTAGYTYKWSDPASQTTAKATGLTANTYTVTVTDSRGCATTQTVTVGQPALPLSATTSNR